VVPIIPDRTPLPNCQSLCSFSVRLRLPLRSSPAFLSHGTGHWLLLFEGPPAIYRATRRPFDFSFPPPAPSAPDAMFRGDFPRLEMEKVASYVVLRKGELSPVLFGTRCLVSFLSLYVYL